MQERLESRVPFVGQEDPLEKHMANPLQYSCLEKSMDRGTPWVDYSPYGCRESDMPEAH